MECFADCYNTILAQSREDFCKIQRSPSGGEIHPPLPIDFAKLFIIMLEWLSPHIAGERHHGGTMHYCMSSIICED
jgi:hypothetical protein